MDERVLINVKRLLALAARPERRAPAAGRYRVGSRVRAAREPKLLRASTRLAATRTSILRSPGPNFGAGVPYKPTPTPKFDALPTAPPRPEAASAITPESLGLGPASFEWLFGDPGKALAHPDVTPGPVVALPVLSPAERTARRVARLTARGGTPFGRGARINEGPAQRPDSPASAGTPGSPAAVGRAAEVVARSPAVPTPTPTPSPAPTPRAATPMPAAAGPSPVPMPATPMPRAADRSPVPMPATPMPRAAGRSPVPMPATPMGFQKARLDDRRGRLDPVRVQPAELHGVQGQCVDVQADAGQRSSCP